MFRYEKGQTKALIPLSRDGLNQKSTTFSRNGSVILEENDWLNNVGQETYELRDFSSLEGLTSAQSTYGISKSSYTPLLAANEDSRDYKNTDIHPCREYAPGRVKKQKRTWLFSGWRVGVTSNVCLATVVLILNMVLTIWASLSFPMDGGFGTLIQGDCDKVKSWALWLHLAINVLSTLLLGASNYAMQCLAAPTRQEVDKAHKEGKGVRIGVGGIQNLLYIGGSRAIIFALLVVSSVPLHLLYNSAIFKTLTARQYHIFVVNESFTPGAVNNNSLFLYNETGDGFGYGFGYGFRHGFGYGAEYYGEVSNCSEGWNKEYESPCGPIVGQPSLMVLQQKISVLQHLSPSECIAAYATEFLTNRGSLLAVTNATAFEDRVITAAGATIKSSVYGSMQSVVSISTPEAEDNPFAWICADIESFANGTDPCSLSLAQKTESNWTIFDYPIEYCLSEPKDGLCTLEFSLVIMIVVILANAIKALAMASAIISFGRENPLVTFGDAAASFLENPDPLTKGFCLVDYKGPTYPEVPSDYLDVTTRQIRPPSPGFQSVDRSPRPFVKPHSLWFKASSPHRWAVTFSLYIVALLVCGLLLYMSIKAVGVSGETSFTYLWSLGFGNVSTSSLIDWYNEAFNEPILSMILIANTPQVILSLLYFLYNALYTSMLAENEWQRYSHKRRSLRVTAPMGQQRSTYFLSLPYRYAISLMVVSALLHWLVSQSIFLARVTIVDEFDGPVSGGQITTCGWSSIAIVFVIIVGALMLIVAFTTGFRGLKGYMPVARGSSIAISAACHPHELDRKASVLPVQWGAIDEEEPGHCTLTSRFVFEPVAGQLYA